MGCFEILQSSGVLGSHKMTIVLSWQVYYFSSVTIKGHRHTYYENCPSSQNITPIWSWCHEILVMQNVHKGRCKIQRAKFEVQNSKWQFSFAERLRVKLAVIHGEGIHKDEQQEDGRSSPPPPGGPSSPSNEEPLKVTFGDDLVRKRSDSDFSPKMLRERTTSNPTNPSKRTRTIRNRWYIDWFCIFTSEPNLE